MCADPMDDLYWIRGWLFLGSYFVTRIPFCNTCNSKNTDLFVKSKTPLFLLLHVLQCYKISEEKRVYVKNIL